MNNYQDIKQALASVQHRIWAHWMKYLFSVCRANEDGSMTIPVELVARWRRQVQTHYDRLSPEEQKSDVAQAEKVLQAIARWLSDGVDSHGGGGGA